MGTGGDDALEVVLLQGLDVLEGESLEKVLLTEAARQYLERAAVRPVVRDAVEAVMEENDELLSRLAR